MQLQATPTFTRQYRDRANLIELYDYLDGNLQKLNDYLDLLRRGIEAHFPSTRIPLAIGTIAANATVSFTQQFAGAQGQKLSPGTPIVVGWDHPMVPGVIFSAQVATANTITIFVTNTTGGNAVMGTGIATLVAVLP